MRSLPPATERSVVGAETELPSRRLIGPAVTYIRAFLSAGEVVLLKEDGNVDTGPILLIAGEKARRFLDSSSGRTDGGSGSRKRRRPNGESGGNTRRKAKEREVQHLRRAVRQIAEVFAVDEDDEEVAINERDLMVQYKSRFDWLVKQSGLKLGIGSASNLVRFAEAVGGPRAIWDWRIVLDCWRARGKLTTNRKAAGASSQPSQQARWPTSSQDAATYMLGAAHAEIPSLNDTIGAVWTLSKAVDNAESCVVLQRIYERLRLAGMYEQYFAACQMMAGEEYDASIRELAAGGQPGNPSVPIRDDMFRQVYLRNLIEREWENEEWPALLQHGGMGGSKCAAWLDVEGSSDARMERGRFEKKLIKGARWFRFRLMFGKFALGMVPGTVVTDTWVYKCRKEEWDAFLGLVKQFCPGQDVMRANGYLIGRLLGPDRLPRRRCGLELLRSDAEIEAMTGEERFALLQFHLGEEDMDGAMPEDVLSQRPGRFHGIVIPDSTPALEQIEEEDEDEEIEGIDLDESSDSYD